MIILKKVADLNKVVASIHKTGKSTGFVPTMGALHEGHLSLIEQSRKIADVTICSIFVNPTQFNDPEDLKKYPITTDQDITLLESAKVDYLFLPTVEEIYPKDSPKKHYDLGQIETVLEGAHRPGHFQGVAEVIDRLLTLIKPSYIIMGQKDFQQVKVVTKLIELIGSQTKLVTSPTHREQTGLALSSRNARLSQQELQQATAISKALLYGRQHIKDTDPRTLEQEMSSQLMAAGFGPIDYVAICHPNNLSPIQQYQTGMDVVILVAAFLGQVRLIDNMLI
ncbi:pantoate--beta-alanine ligase [Arachidicoccus rhizosphaerae]|uniref:Pantothenate synthetase n=1 Tax=Arachidicoccus rhizosphaerae TaxID=551991 RepID=A0A1H3XAH1_9BACT|nr:pantoate--beta-alanine ligase [Arachidicoccus rhizosphaerae]SDZ96395.1 pantoate--beta-alanine ligase [Arachidicoccus rhizosphaerae]